MKLKFLFILVIFPLLLISEFKKAVTFGLGGRLGDNVLDYTHAKWISEKWKIPLLLSNFEYSNQFVFDDVEDHLTEEKKAKYRIVRLTSFSQLSQPVKENTLFLVVHVCDNYNEFVFNGSYNLFIPVNWKNQNFREKMKKLIAVKSPLTLIEPPKDKISVALHYRAGGGYIYDTPGMKRSLPLRFPEDEYYFKQLNKLYSMVGGDSLYVHIFTDSQEPLKVKKNFENAFKKKNIIFNCRTSNHHSKNVLEDLYSMMKFDCLIRPMSHFSMIASHLTDYQIDMVPKHGVWKQNHFIVDEVEITQRGRWSILKKKWLNH